MGRKQSQHTKQLIRTRKEALGFTQMQKIVDLVKVKDPCYLTDVEIAQVLEISDRQVRTYLKRLCGGGILQKEVRHSGTPFGVRSRRILSSGEIHASPEGEVGRQVDAEPGPRPTGSDS